MSLASPYIPTAEELELEATLGNYWTLLEAVPEVFLKGLGDME